MFSNFTIALLMGLGIGAWVYAKTYRRTGGNRSNALVIAALTGVLVIIVVTTILGIIF